MGQIGGVPQERFVGRDREVQAAQRALAAVGSGRSAALAIVGEQGIGKTCLLRELSSRAEASGFQTFSGGALELESDTPFGPFIDALDERLGDLDSVSLRRLGKERLAELAVVIPSLAGQGGELASSLNVERYRFHYAMRAVLKVLVQDGSLALLLDDIHWADPASVELVSFLLRKPLPGMLLVHAYRPGAAPQLSRLTTHALREGRLQLVELGPLSRDDAATMLGDRLVRPAMDVLYEESGGNPFYLEQLVRVRKGSGSSVLPPGARWADDRGELPATLLTTVRHELAALSPAARQLAQCAAVVGDPFDVDMAFELGEMSEPGAWTTLDELVAAGVVRPTSVPGHLRFWHPIKRRAVYDTAGHGWRIWAHRRAAEVLAHRGAPLAARAHHVMQGAAAVGDQDAISLLIEAGDATAPRAPAAAVSWYQCAERLMADDAPTRQRLSLLKVLATTFASLGRLQDSRSALRKALALPLDSPSEMARLTALLGRTELGLGRGEAARRLLKAGLETSDPEGPETAELLLELARNRNLSQSWDEAFRIGVSVLELAHKLDERELSIAASASLAYFASGCVGAMGSEAADGAAAVMEQNLNQGAQAIDALSDEGMSPLLLDALVLLIRAELLSERWEAAARHARRGVRICRVTGQGAHFLEVMGRLAPALAHQGRLVEAREVVDVVAEAMQLVENDEMLILSDAMRCWIVSLQGHTGAALAAGKSALRVADQSPDTPAAWRARTSYGEALIEAGRCLQGRKYILAAGGPDLCQVVPSTRTRWYRALTEAAMADGRVDEARDMARRARLVADQIGLPMRLGDAWYAEAAASLVAGRVDRGCDEAREAVAAYERSGVPIEAGRARLLVGTALARAGDQRTAVREFEFAHRIFGRCGAIRLGDRAARELRQLGHRIGRKSQNANGNSHVDGALLSEREHEVAALVAEGRTTRQVAKELYVSPKTVETHLTHIYAKLGVSSRVAMVAALAPSHEAEGD